MSTAVRCSLRLSRQSTRSPSGSRSVLRPVLLAFAAPSRRLTAAARPLTAAVSSLSLLTTAGTPPPPLPSLTLPSSSPFAPPSCRRHFSLSSSSPLSARPVRPLLPLRALPASARLCCSHAGIMHASTSGGTSVAGREVLPTNVRPAHYDLTLEPNFVDFTYNGTVLIDLDVKEDSRSIALNANDLKFHDTAVLVDGVAITETPTVAFDADKQTVTISFDHVLPAGSKAQLRQTFTGNLNDQMAGFYRAAYRNPDGTTGYLASTQFEATDARRAFPCFDEPALKARFTVTLVADRELTCLSNMDVANESEVHSTIANGPRKAVRFNTTPLMSTYLVAFIVGHLKYVETNAFRVPIRVYVSPDQDPEHGRFALDVAVKSLSLYERTFDNEYPLPKMDMVSVPDFAAGAMENWGLVTYRAVALLYNEKTSGAAAKNQIAGIVAHELAHQWFGNLVTMDFWEGLWLNEGFATWMSLYACDVFYPEWKIWEDYVNSEFQFALELDSLRSSHPIEVPVKRADEVDQIFDAISYSKGSAVLRMIAKYIGTKTFLDGVKLYIHKHAYGNTRTADLWQALTETSGQPIDKVMGVWTTKVGYPVVSVTENPEKSSITVKQNRFLRTGDLAPEDDENIYPVALGLRTAKGVEESMLSAREAELKLDDLNFFKLNADQSALYRTAYSPERLSKLGAAAKEGRLTVEDRTGMIADAGALALAGYGKTSGALSLLKSFGTETEYIVWAGLLSQLAEIRRNFIFEDEKIKDALKAFTRALAAPKAHELGWEFSPEDSYTTQQFKALMFGAAGTAGDEKVVAAAREVFERFAAGDHDAINPNIRRSVFSIVLRNGGEREYEIVLNFFRNAPTSAEKNSALSTLGFAPDPALQRRTLALTLSDEVRAQDMRLPLVAIAAHAHGIELQWEWFKENYNQLLKRLPPENMTFSYLLDRILQPLTQRQQIEKVQAFFGEKSLKGFDKAFEQNLDAMHARAGYLERDHDDVVSWLKQNGLLAAEKL